MTIIYATIMFLSGCISHCILVKLHNWVFNRNRAIRVDDERKERRVKYSVLKQREHDLDDDYYSSDDSEEFTGEGPKSWLQKTKKCVWIICYNCCGVKSDRIV